VAAKLGNFFRCRPLLREFASSQKN